MSQETNDIELKYEVFEVGEEYMYVEDNDWHEYKLKLYKDGKLQQRYNSLLGVYCAESDKRLSEDEAVSTAKSILDMIQDLDEPENWFIFHSD
jgi:hypothetical protein